MKLFRFLMSFLSLREKDECFYAPLSVVELGKSGDRVFTPQPLLSFYCLHKVLQTKKSICASVSEIKLLVLYHPKTHECMKTAFAIKDKNGWIWCTIGENRVYLSSFESFEYKETDTYRVYLDLPNKRTVFAVCKYDKGDVQVARLMEEDIEKKTATEIPNTVCPCDLPTAAKFAETL